LDFLPPEDLVAVPEVSRKESRQTHGLALVLRKYGKEHFLRIVRQKAASQGHGRNRRFGVPRSLVLNPAIIGRAYRNSRPGFVRRVMEPVMKRRFWTDERCIALTRVLRELAPGRLLDIATGPGGLICRALPQMKATEAFGLEIYFDACRTVMAEAEYFGFGKRLQMVHGDARVMPFPASSFDCVSGWTAMYHISRYDVAVREIARVLRPGGHFVGTFHTVYHSHCQDVLTRAEEEEFIRCARLPLDIHEVCSVVQAVGLTVRSKVAVGNSHLVVARRERDRA